jgi:high-affinity Fe2+/Pb2+ permease
MLITVLYYIITVAPLIGAIVLWWTFLRGRSKRKWLAFFGALTFTIYLAINLFIVLSFELYE